MDRLSYQTEIYNPIIKSNFKGFIDTSSLETLKKNTKKVIIPIGMQYRPDLVAQYFLGDQASYWVIDYLNNFLNGIEDYTEGRSIIIPA